MENWVEEELANSKLGDKRLDKRNAKIMRALSESPSRTLREVFQSSADIKGCYRFFDSDLVTEESIFNPHKEATIKRIKECPVVLVPSDSSSLNFSSKPSIKGTGMLTKKFHKGLWIHSSIAITPDRLSLGQVYFKFWSRKEFRCKTGHESYKDSIENKENYCWLESYEAANSVAIQCPNTHVISLMDREADFAELFEYIENKRGKGQNTADIIVRAQHDRNLVDIENPKSGKSEKLRSLLMSSPPLGKIQFTIPGRDGASPRAVEQSLHASKVSFRKRQVSRKKTVVVTVNAVLAKEISVPPEGKEPLNWVLFTTLPIEDLNQVKQIIDYYLSRWEIETFFKVLKSGCKAEEKGLKCTTRLQPLIVMLMIISWRVMYVMMLGRTCPQISCDIVFSDFEWRASWMVANKGKPVPSKPPSLSEMILIVAGFGGYKYQKKSPPPGVKVIWNGICRAHDYARALDAFVDLPNEKM